MRLAETKELEVQNLKVYSDSQLVVGKIKGNYKAWEENIVKYLKRVKDLTHTFCNFEV